MFRLSSSLAIFSTTTGRRLTVQPSLLGLAAASSSGISPPQTLWRPRTSHDLHLWPGRQRLGLSNLNASSLLILLSPTTLNSSPLPSNLLGRGGRGVGLNHSDW